MIDSVEEKHKLNYFLIGSVSAVILAIPFRPLWSSYSIILLAAVGLGNAIILKKIEKQLLFLYLLGAAYIVRVIWIFRAEDFSYALGRLETEFPLLAFPLIFSTFNVTSKIKSIAVRVYCVMMMMTMAYSFFQLILYFQDSPYTFSEYTLFHLDPIWFWEHSRNFAQKMLTWEGAHYSFISIAVLYGLHLVLYIERKTKEDKWLLTIYAAMTFLFLVYTGSRIGFFAFVAALIGYAVFSGKLIFENKSLSVVFFGLCIFVLIVGLSKWGSQIEPIRYHYWSRAVTAIKEDLLLGHGTGAGRIIMHEPEFEQKIGWEVNHPHDQYLTELMQFGLLGSIPLFLFLLFAMWHGLVFKDRELLSVLLTGMIFMITEAPFNSNKGIVPFVFLICLLANFSAYKNKREVRR